MGECELNFDRTIPKVINELVEHLDDLLLHEYLNSEISFIDWLALSSDYEINCIYERIFSKNFKKYITNDTLRVLMYFSQNFSSAVYTLYDIKSDIDLISDFIPKFIHNQFISMDPYQLLFSEKKNNISF